jgi:lipopolysaccharide export system permease protein
MKILSRYLAAHFIGPFLFATLFFVSFLLIFQMFRLINLVINKSVSLWVLGEMVFHTAVSFLPMAFPLASLFAALYTMNKLSEDAEIVAMRSFGLSKHRILMPFLVLGILIGSMIYSLNAELIPYSRSMFRNTLVSLTSDGVLADIRSEVFFTDIPRVTLFAQQVSDDGEKLSEVFLHLRDQEGSAERVIHAKRGVLIKESRGEWRSPSLRLFLEDGNMARVDPESGSLDEILFETYDFPIAVGDFSQNLMAKDSMMTNTELLEQMDENRSALASFESDESNATENEINFLTQQYFRTQLEYWTRLNTPIQCVLFIFMGFCFGIKKSRGEGSRFSTIITLGSLVLYYAVFFLGVSMVKKGTLEPMIAVYAPTAFLFLVVLFFYRKLDWQS